MYKKFLKLLEAKGVSAYKVSKETGISQATLSQWKGGQYELKADKLQKIADYFGVPITYFYGNDAPEISLSPQELKLLDLFSELNEEGKEKVIEYMKFLLQEGYIKSDKSGVVGA